VTRIDRLTLVVSGHDPAGAARLGREVAAQLARMPPATAAGAALGHVRVGPLPAPAAPEDIARAVAARLDVRTPEGGAP
jgi:hypothetical protein